MGRIWKTQRIAGAVLAVCLLLSGCSFKIGASPEDLYSLPQLPVEYTELNGCISALLSGGAEYAAPLSGSNTQSVQMVDLDGDGRLEALAFLRNSAEEKPLKIYIFSLTEDGYQQSDVIEGSGSAIYSISYRDLNGDGQMELLVGWKVAADLQALSVYTKRAGQVEELTQANYVRYIVTALDSSRPESELVILRADDEGSGVADLYTWDRNTLNKTSSARLSMTMAELNSGRMTSGALQDETPALFVSGVSDSSVEITDILTIKKGELVNIALSATTGVTTELYAYQSLFPTDINGDGVTEVPAPTPVLLQSGEESYDCFVDWRAYDADGVGKSVGYTYHDNDDGWYLELPDSWVNRVTVGRAQSGTNETAVSFYIRSGIEEDIRELLRIYTITGDSREIKASRGNRFILGRQAETIYAAEVLESNGKWKYGITEDELRSGFKLITTEWRAGEN
jgi:hypothetical protein